MGQTVSSLARRVDARHREFMHQNVEHNHQLMTQCNESVSSTVQESNSNAIHFHPITSDGLVRSANGISVHKKKRLPLTRSKSGLSFSHRPVIADEILVIEATNVAIVVGFVREDPLQVMSYSPKRSIDLVNRSLTYAFVFERCEHLMIEMYYNRNGDIHCTVNGIESAIVFSAIPLHQQQWALIELNSSDRQISRFVSSNAPHKMMKINVSSSSSSINVNTSVCCICYSAISDALIGPCGHRVICFHCAHKWTQYGNRGCPYCRAFLTHITRLR